MKNVPTVFSTQVRTCAAYIIWAKQTHYILQYLCSYLLASSWLPFHITLLLLCSVMLIIFSCWTVWWNITMTLSSSPPRGVGADIDAAISSLITCLFTFSFLRRRMPFHTTIPKRIQTMWVQYGLLPHSSACLPQTPRKSYPPTLFLQPHPFSPVFLGVDRPFPFPLPPTSPTSPPVTGLWAVCMC